MNGHGEKLTRKQETAIGALLARPTILEAAKDAGVGEATLRRWLKGEDFTAAYRTARRQAVEKAIAQLQAASWAAATTLLKLLGAESEAVRLRAATAILEHAHKGVELVDLEERLELEALEATQATHTNGRARAWR